MLETNFLGWNYRQATQNKNRPNCRSAMLSKFRNIQGLANKKLILSQNSLSITLFGMQSCKCCYYMARSLVYVDGWLALSSSDKSTSTPWPNEHNVNCKQLFYAYVFGVYIHLDWPPWANCRSHWDVQTTSLSPDCLINLTLCILWYSSCKCAQMLRILIHLLLLSS